MNTRKIPNISVIIPSYNHELYVQDAIESALSSSIEDIEVIIVDDGSTDNSVEIIKEIKDPRLKLICQENRGAANAINHGVSLANAPWIAILNSDDMFHPQKLETHMKIHAQDKKLEASICRNRIISPDGRPFDKKHRFVQEYIRVQKTYFRYQSIFKSLLVLNHLSTTSALFIRKDVFSDIGGFVPLRYTHDWFMFLCLSARGHFHIIEEPLVDYRRHEANTLLEDRDMVDIEANFLIEWHLFQEFSKQTPAIDIGEALELLEENNYVYFELLHFFKLWRQLNSNYFIDACSIFGKNTHPIIQNARQVLEIGRIKRPLIDKLEARLDQLEERLKNREERLEKMSNTLSWRITAPLRKINLDQWFNTS